MKVKNVKKSSDAKYTALREMEDVIKANYKSMLSFMSKTILVKYSEMEIKGVSE